MGTKKKNTIFHFSHWVLALSLGSSWSLINPRICPADDSGGEPALPPSSQMRPAPAPSEGGPESLSGRPGGQPFSTSGSTQFEAIQARFYDKKTTRPITMDEMGTNMIWMGHCYEWVRPNTPTNAVVAGFRVPFSTGGPDFPNLTKDYLVLSHYLASSGKAPAKAFDEKPTRIWRTFDNYLPLGGGGLIGVSSRPGTLQPYGRVGTFSSEILGSMTDPNSPEPPPSTSPDSTPPLPMDVEVPLWRWSIREVVDAEEGNRFGFFYLEERSLTSMDGVWSYSLGRVIGPLDPRPTRYCHFWRGVPKITDYTVFGFPLPKAVANVLWKGGWFWTDGGWRNWFRKN